MTTTTRPARGETYALGHSDTELDRLDLQATHLAPATRMLLTQAGLQRGMRVLDVGTGTGEVALIAAELVGPDGSVLGIDRSAAALARARAKVERHAVGNVRFAPVDVAHDLPTLAVEGFDAVVGRLVLPYLPDPVARVAEMLARLRPGGVVALLEFDLAGVRSHPPTPQLARAIELITLAFEAAGQAQDLAVRLDRLLRRAGVHDPRQLGAQNYVGAQDPVTPALVCGVLHSLRPAIERHGLASDAELDLKSLGERIAAELDEHDAVSLTPTLVGAWGVKASTVEI